MYVHERTGTELRITDLGNIVKFRPLTSAPLALNSPLPLPQGSQLRPPLLREFTLRTTNWMKTAR